MRLLYTAWSLKQCRIHGFVFFFVIMILCVHHLCYSVDKGGTFSKKIDHFQFNYKSSSPEYSSWSIIPSVEKFTSQFIWNNISLCPSLSNYDRTIVIIINSARANFDRRHLQRRTWGSIKYYRGWTVLALNFLLGQKENDEDSSIEENLQKEFDLHGDTTMGNFTDTYRNLTLKSIMGFEWVIEFCPKAQVVIKGDDDVVMNIFQMIKLLNNNPSFYLNSSNIYGDTEYDKGPIRNPTDKWFVSREDYPGSLYPTYCSGFGQLTTVNLIEKILVELRNFKTRISMDDIFMTGILPESHNQRMKREVIKRVHINGTWEFPDSPESVQELRRWYNNNLVESEETDDGLLPIFYIIAHGKDFELDFVRVWNKVKIVSNIVW